MINLLPPHRKNDLRKEYLFRLSAAHLLFLMFALVIGATLLLPSYFLAQTREDVARAEVAALKSTEGTEVEEIKAELLLVKERLSALSRMEERVPFHQTIDALALTIGESISITNMSYRRAAAGEASSIALGGKAATREALISFTQALEGHDLFDSVVLPVSSLAKDRDIEFNIEVTGMF